MKEDSFENIGKKLPYRESDEYLDTLLDRVAENAVQILVTFAVRQFLPYLFK